MNDRLSRLGLRSAQILAIIALAAVVVYGLLQVTLVVVAVLVALIIAASLEPVVGWLRSKGVPSMLATWITLLAGIVVIGGVLTFVVFAVHSQWAELSKAASDGLNQLQNFLAHGPIPITHEQLDAAKQTVVDYLTSRQFGSGALTGLSVVGQIVTGAVLAAVTLFFFLKDGKTIWGFFLKPLHGEWRQRGNRIARTSLAVLGGYARGTALIAFVDAAAIGIGLVVLQVPLALPLAVVVFLTSFIPMIGATLAGALAALVALVANGPLVALVVVGIVIAVNQVEGNFLQPVVMSQSVSLHPLVILLALTVGTILGGVIGAVLAVPFTALGWAIAKVWNPPSAESAS